MTSPPPSFRDPGPPNSNPQSLRVVLVSTQRAWHGGEDQARLLAEGLRQRGHECHVLARAGGQFGRRMAEAGFDVSYMPRGMMPGSWMRMRAWVRRWNPHVIHFNDGHAVTRGGVALWGIKQPVRVAARRVDFPLRSSLVYRWMCDRVVCVSRAVADVCRHSGVPDCQLRVVHDGVSPQRAQGGDRERGRACLGIEDDQPLLLTVAKLTDHKGHRFLIDAMPSVIERYPRVCLALAGDGELTESLRERTRQLGIGSNVRFLGFRRDVPDLLQAADLFVLPSRMEGLCTSIIDAMLAGRPLVATTAGGIPDLIASDDPHTPPMAWSVPPEDSGALAAAMIEALGDPPRRVARATRARQRAEEMFLAEHMVDATLRVYREAWSERRQPTVQGLRPAA